MTMRCALLIALLASPAFGQAPAVKPQTKFINDELKSIWQKNGIKQASSRCSDSEFARRVFLDLIGRIPTAEEVLKFRSSGANRSKLVNDLLYSKEPKSKSYAEQYATHMADLWTVWLLTRTGNATYHDQMKLWLEEQFAKNASYKDIVTELITAKGKTNDNGAVNFILSNLGERVANGKEAEEGNFEMVPVTSRTTRLFLGLQTQCVQCHDHPFNPEWKQQSFWGVNAFFRQVAREGTPIMRQNNRMELTAKLELKDDDAANKDGIVYYERRNGMILPTSLTFVDGRKAEMSTSKTRRELLADMIVTHENFPKAVVNRMWGMLFGRGLNEQAVVDDFGEHNKVVHPELLDKLAKDFAYANYDLKELLTWICNSDAYSLSSKPNDLGTNAKSDTDVFFSRMLLKAMTPEQLLASCWVATRGDPTREVGDSKELKKLQEDWTRKLVTNFGDDEGNEVNFNGTVVQALLMMNGPEINKEIAAPNGTLMKSVKQHKNSYGAVINDIYMAALSRQPNGQETSAINRIANKYGGRVDQTFFTDVMWAVLNSNEFILNH